MRLRRRDDDLRPVEELDYRRGNLVLRWNRPSTGTLRLSSEEARNVERGSGLLLDIGGDVVWSGSVVEWRRADTPDDDVVELTVRGDMALLEGRLAYPDHETPADGDQPDRMDRSGPAGEVLAEMVRRHAGEDALPGRQIDALTVDDADGVGDTVRARRRYPVVAEEVERLGRKGGVVCSLQQCDDTLSLAFRVAQQRDRRRDVVFSRPRGTLVDVEAEFIAPQATVAIVAGPGEGSDRLIVEVADDDAVDEWGRIETWVDARNAADPDDPEDDQIDDLQERGEDELDDKAADDALSLTIVEAQSARWRHDWQIGDVVTVDIDGEQITKVVEEVEVQIEPGDGPDGAAAITAKPTLGRRSPTRSLRVVEELRDLQQRVTLRGKD